MRCMLVILLSTVVSLSVSVQRRSESNFSCPVVKCPKCSETCDSVKEKRENNARKRIHQRFIAHHSSRHLHSSQHPPPPPPQQQQQRHQVQQQQQNAALPQARGLAGRTSLSKPIPLGLLHHSPVEVPPSPAIVQLNSATVPRATQVLQTSVQVPLRSQPQTFFYPPQQQTVYFLQQPPGFNQIRPKHRPTKKKQSPKVLQSKVQTAALPMAKFAPLDYPDEGELRIIDSLPYQNLRKAPSKKTEPKSDKNSTDIHTTTIKTELLRLPKSSTSKSVLDHNTESTAASTTVSTTTTSATTSTLTTTLTTEKNATTTATTAAPITSASSTTETSKTNQKHSHTNRKRKHSHKRKRSRAKKNRRNKLYFNNQAKPRRERRKHHSNSKSRSHGTMSPQFFINYNISPSSYENRLKDDVVDDDDVNDSEGSVQEIIEKLKEEQMENSSYLCNDPDLYELLDKFMVEDAAKSERILSKLIDSPKGTSREPSLKGFKRSKTRPPLSAISFLCSDTIPAFRLVANKHCLLTKGQTTCIAFY